MLHNLSFSIMKAKRQHLSVDRAVEKVPFMNILARFWDISEGEILLRGKNIKALPMAVLMDNISMVFQRVYLFEGHHREQYCHGMPQLIGLQ